MLPDVGRPPDAIAQSREEEHGPQHLDAERSAQIGMGRRAAPDDAAEIENVELIACCHGALA